MTKNKNRKRKILARKGTEGRTYAKTLRAFKEGVAEKRPAGSWKPRLESVTELCLTNDEMTPITESAMKAAQCLLDFIDSEDLDVPGIYPGDGGGVTLEWGSADHVLTVEIDPNATISIFFLDAITKEPWFRDDIVNNLKLAASYMKLKAPRRGYIQSDSTSVIPF